MEQTKAPWHARLAFTLAILLPVYFAVAALGTKFGLWGFQVGLLSLTFGAGMFLLGIVAIVSLVSLILIVRKPPRKGWFLPIVGLLVPAGFLALGASAAGTAGENPIHDVATDTANPPAFSEAKLAARAEIKANPISDYAVPLGQTEFWEGRVEGNPIADQSHAQIIAERYPDLAPLPLGDASEADALAAVEQAMADIGLTEVSANSESGTVEGVAETFWFGFKDDVVARVADGEIDFRSVSRVGQSDLGANSARIEKLRAVVAARLTE